MYYDNTRVKIDLDAIERNIDRVREKVGVPILAVIKADAYGHGAVQIARLLQKEIVVQGNPRVYKALRNQLDAVLMELRRVESAGQVEPERMDQIEYMVRIMEGLNEKHDT